MTNNQIFVEWPPGAGGAFLISVLTCCTTNAPWVSEQQINFHKSSNFPEGGHQLEPAQNVISIDSPNARYNFWINYFRKKVIYEFTTYRHLGQRWVKNPYYEEFTSQQNGYWLLDQCRFIIQYESQQSWKIDWKQMMCDPVSTWETIQKFLDANNQPNYWNIDQWIYALDDYKKTSQNIKLNPNHVSWQIWAVALLQQQGITPDFNVVDNFRTPLFFQWLDTYKQDLVKTTKNLTFNIG
jgi:hypothetical protein